MYEIKSSNYLKERTILIDGITVTMTAPGAGTELDFSRSQRRMEYLDKKLKAGTITDAEMDLYDELEKKSLAYFEGILHDGTEDNGQVRAWVQRTPLNVIVAAFDDMKKQFEQTDAEAQKDGDEPGTTEA